MPADLYIDLLLQDALQKDGGGGGGGGGWGGTVRSGKAGLCSVTTTRFVPQHHLLFRRTLISVQMPTVSVVGNGLHY